MNWTYGLLTLVVVVSNDARAATPFTSEKGEVDVTLGYGWRTAPRSLDDDVLQWANPYRFGLGVGGGYTFEQGVHVGVSADFFPAGESRHSAWLIGGGESRSGWAYTSVLQLMGEAGYDLSLSPAIVLRPTLAAGAVMIRMRENVPDIPAEYQRFGIRDRAFVLAPGATVLMDVGPIHFLVRGRYNLGVGPERFVDAVVVDGGVGATF